MSQGPADLQSAALAIELCTHGCPIVRHQRARGTSSGWRRPTELLQVKQMRIANPARMHGHLQSCHNHQGRGSMTGATSMIHRPLTTRIQRAHTHTQAPLELEARSRNFQRKNIEEYILRGPLEAWRAVARDMASGHTGDWTQGLPHAERV